MKDLTVLGITAPLTIELTDGRTIEHLGAAKVSDGHLYLTESPIKEACSVSAVYAPGSWKCVTAGDKG